MPLIRFIKKKKSGNQEDTHLHAVPNPESSENEEHHDESNWLISYADMMTLLCTFFIMMFALTNLEKEDAEKVKEEVSKHFKGAYEVPNQDLAQFMTQTIQELGVDKDTIVESTSDGVTVTFQSTVFFDTLNAELTLDGLKILDEFVGTVIRKQTETNQGFRVAVEGHTDARPILGGSYPSNWELSGARAARVVRLFLDKGFRSTDVVAIAHGGTRPLHPSRTPAGEWDLTALSKNRRVVVRILNPEAKTLPWETSAH